MLSMWKEWMIDRWIYTEIKWSFVQGQNKVHLKIHERILEWIFLEWLCITVAMGWNEDRIRIKWWMKAKKRMLISNEGKKCGKLFHF